MTNKLRVLRAERRLSQKRVAREAGIGFDRYWRIESDLTDPDDDERVALSRVLGVVDGQIFPDAPRLSGAASAA